MQMINLQQSVNSPPAYWPRIGVISMHHTNQRPCLKYHPLWVHLEASQQYQLILLMAGWIDCRFHFAWQSIKWIMQRYGLSPQGIWPNHPTHFEMHWHTDPPSGIIHPLYRPHRNNRLAHLIPHAPLLDNLLSVLPIPCKMPTAL